MSATGDPIRDAALSRLQRLGEQVARLQRIGARHITRREFAAGILCLVIAQGAMVWAWQSVEHKARDNSAFRDRELCHAAAIDVSERPYLTKAAQADVDRLVALVRSRPDTCEAIDRDQILVGRGPQTRRDPAGSAGSPSPRQTRTAPGVSAPTPTSHASRHTSAAPSPRRSSQRPRPPSSSTPSRNPTASPGPSVGVCIKPVGCVRGSLPPLSVLLAEIVRVELAAL